MVRHFATDSKWLHKRLLDYLCQEHNVQLINKNMKRQKHEEYTEASKKKKTINNSSIVGVST